ncbi:hypothetical protein C8R46DRAFT_1214892 [Mycena filopes]|nr:hypothetical protein C8R46DRAFT_1214892 [Mycena filopes]
MLFPTRLEPNSNPYYTAQATAFEADCCSSLGDFRTAARLCAESRELAAACGMAGSIADTGTQVFQAELHMLKTEYREARAINEYIVTAQPAHTFKIALAHVNLALIGGASGEPGPEGVRAHADVAWGEFEGRLSFPLGFELCNIVYADLRVADGDSAAAGLLLTSAFRALRGKVDEGAVLCLERLADLGLGMYGVEDTLGWVGVYLASAHKAQNRLAKVKAVRCLRDVMAALGDEGSALRLFEVALDEFLLMGVHGWAGDAMVRMAAIVEKDGEDGLGRALDLLRQARPLFERSGLGTQVGLVEARVASLACNIPN